MKLKEILSFVCFACLLLSCSMEDDVLNSIDNGNNKGSGQVEHEMLIAFTANMQKASATKSNDPENEKPTDVELAIEYCSLILADEQGMVLTATDQVYLNSTSTFTVDGVEYTNVIVTTSSASENMIKYVVKTGKKYQVMVVANSNQKLAACTTLTDIENKIQTGFPEALVKIGRTIVDLTDQDGFKTQKENTEHTVFASVSLQQLAARIELAGFTVEKFINGTQPADVVIRKIEISNINTQSYLTENAKYSVPAYTSDSKTYKTGITVYKIGDELNKTYSFIDNQNVHTFYSYRNNAEGTNKLTMTIHYTVGGAEKTSKPFVINRADNGGSGSIDSNTIYRLFVKASVTSDELLLDNILCYTQDWNEVNVNIGNLTEVKK